MIRTLCIALCVVLAGCASTPDGPPSGQAVAKHQTVPRYPRELAEAGLQGCVVASFLIQPDGRAEKFRIERSEPKGLFDHATVTALSDWRFEPPSRPGRYAYPVEYKIAGKPTPPPECKAPTFEQLNPEAAKS